MKISKKEKLMIFFLIIFCVCCGYFYFVFSAFSEKIESKKQEEASVINKYNTTMDTINGIENEQSAIKILNAQIVDKSGSFYPVLSEEHLVLELSKFINDSGLDGGFSFDKASVGPVKLAKTYDTDLSETTLQASVDKYKSKYGTIDGKDTDDETEDNKNSDSKNDKTDDNADNKDSKSEDNTVEQMKVTLTYQGSYESVLKFMESLRKYDKKIPIYNASVKFDAKFGVKGTFDMMIYAIPKMTNETMDYLKWNADDGAALGKGDPFVEAFAAGTAKNPDLDPNDFAISVKSQNSVLPSVTIGKTSDSSRVSYIYADGNKENAAEIVLTKKGDKYFYKYKTDNASYPEDFDKDGIEFVPNGSDMINIAIFSENRTSDKDKSGMNLKVVNDTDKLVNVTVKDDDSENPRVNLDYNSTNTNVSEK